MGQRKRDRLVGMTRFHDETSDRELVNTVTIETTKTEARTVVGSALDAQHRQEQSSSHPAVIGYQMGVTAMMRKMAYAQRPIRNLWVPKGPKPAESSPCPECHGAREILVGCDEDARMVPCPACMGRG